MDGSGTRKVFSGSETSADAEALLGIVAGHDSTELLGYEMINGEGSVELIIRGLAEVPVLEKGQDGEVVLDRTTLYPEGGGQIRDRGTSLTPTARFSVEYTQRLA